MSLAPTARVRLFGVAAGEIVLRTGAVPFMGQDIDNTPGSPPAPTDRNFLGLLTISHGGLTCAAL